MVECIENALIEDPYFREDYLAQYRYDPETNEVIMYFKEQIPRLEATVLIELLAGLIIDVSIVQSSEQGKGLFPEVAEAGHYPEKTEETED